jgi:hypothetical protein
VYGFCFGKDMSSRQQFNIESAKDAVKKYLSTRPRDISQCQFCGKLLSKLLDMVVVYRSTHNLGLFRTSLETLHASVPLGHWFRRVGIQIQKRCFDVGSSSYSPVVLLLSLFSPALSFDNEGDSLCVLGAVCELVMSIIVSRRSGGDVDLSPILPSTKGHALLAATCDAGPFLM